VDSTPDITVAPHEPYGSPTTDTAAAPEWLGCLRETCELLWPPPAKITVDSGGSGWPSPRRAQHPAAGSRPGDSEFALIPGVKRPPLLVPTDRRAAAAAVRHHSATRSPAARLCVRALSIGLAGGLGGALLRGRVLVSAPAGAETIERYLSSVMSCDIRVSIELGRARANRKPVLQMLNGSGDAVGFAKIGVNPLTCKLVRAENESLERLSKAGLKEIEIPRVLHYDRWHGLEILVLSALPAWRPRRSLPAARLAAAMGELARVDGLQTEPLVGGSYLRQLQARLASADEGPEHAALAQSLDALTAQADGTALNFGCWHGDWAPWNMANTGHGLLVWDWERFTGGVPLGFDALHYWLQCEVGMNRSDPRTAAGACLERAPKLLESFGVTARQADLTAVLYLADLATRYLVDRQAQAGARLGAPGTWLIPAIASKVGRL
jgi:hypothetical protein